MANDPRLWVTRAQGGKRRAYKGVYNGFVCWLLLASIVATTHLDLGLASLGTMSPPKEQCRLRPTYDCASCAGTTSPEQIARRRDIVEGMEEAECQLEAELKEEARRQLEAKRWVPVVKKDGSRLSTMKLQSCPREIFRSCHSGDSLRILIAISQDWNWTQRDLLALRRSKAWSLVQAVYLHRNLGYSETVNRKCRR